MQERHMLFLHTPKFFFGETWRAHPENKKKNRGTKPN